MLELIAHLNSLGFPVREIIPDKKHHRFEIEKGDRQAGYYTCFRNCMVGTGQDWYFIIFGSWRTGEKHEYSTLDKATAHHIDSKLLKEQIALAKKQEDKVRQEGYEIAAKECEEKWNQLSVVGKSEYLIRKQVSECPDLEVRFDNFNGDTYIKLVDENAKTWSLQNLRTTGIKILHKGGKKSGNFCPIGDYLKADKIYIAEGIATAASIRMAINEPVICAIDSGNLEHVAIKFRKLFPEKEIVICGDDDRDAALPDGTLHNPGKIHGEKAAAKSRSSLVLPAFKNPRIKNDTDWNDLHVAEGLEAVAEQILTIEKAEPVAVYALGFKEKEYFFTSTSNRQVIGISKFSKSDLLGLLPISDWEREYPGGGAAKVDWDSAVSSLMSMAREKGIFQSQNIRGAGVWSDDGRVVVNMGDHLIVDGRKVELGNLKSRYFYTLGIKLPPLSTSPLTAQECELITSAAHLFRWKKSDFGYLLAGAMVTTRICGALPIRPHLWLTGEAGTGKTTLFNRFIYPLIGHPLLYAAGDSTEAGIRQEVNSNAVPVLFDEFENNGPKSAELIQGNLNLMRVAWSDTFASIIKGSASGVATHYKARFAAIVTSIRQVSMNDADRSRFATIELKPHQSDAEHWEQLDNALNQIDMEFGNRLFARTIKLLPVLLENFQTMKRALCRNSAGQRFADQYGMLLAGYSLLLQDEPISDDQAQAIVSHVSLTEEREEAQTNDQSVALSKLLTTSTIVEYSSGRQTALIGQLIEAVWKDAAKIKNDIEHEKYNAQEKALLILGIKVELDFVAVAYGDHSEQENRIWRGTQWSRSWGKALSRLPHVEKARIRICGKHHSVLKIPVKTLEFQ